MPHHFVNLEKDEKIIHLSREHHIMLVAKLAIWVIVAAAPILVSLFVGRYFADIDTRAQFAWMLIRDTYLLCAILGLFVVIVVHYLNVHIVTNKRVIDIDQIAITSHHTVEASLEKVQDVTAEISGIGGNVFNYGHVTIQSAGDRSRIVFEKVANPRAVKRTILDTVYKTTGKNLS